MGCDELCESKYWRRVRAGMDEDDCLRFPSKIKFVDRFCAV